MALPRVGLALRANLVASLGRDTVPSLPNAGAAKPALHNLSLIIISNRLRIRLKLSLPRPVSPTRIPPVLDSALDSTLDPALDSALDPASLPFPGPPS